jgi:hypothetical protein
MLIVFDADERGQGRRPFQVAVDHFGTPSAKISIPEDSEAWIRVTTTKGSDEE